MFHNRWVGLGIVVCFVVGIAWGMRPHGTAPNAGLPSQAASQQEPATREPITVALDDPNVPRTTAPEEPIDPPAPVSLPTITIQPNFPAYSPPAPTIMPDVPTYSPSSVGFGGPGIGTGGRGAFDVPGPK